MGGQFSYLTMVWGSLAAALGIMAVILKKDTQTASGRLRNNAQLRQLRRDSDAARTALAEARAEATPTAVAWNDAMLNAQAHYYLPLSDARWELFFALNPQSGRCLAETNRLRIMEMGLEVDGQRWLLTELAKARIVGSGSETVRRLQLTDRDGYVGVIQFDAGGGRAGMADAYDACKTALTNAWTSFEHTEPHRQHTLAVAQNHYAETVRTSHELDEIAQNFMVAVAADPSLRRLWQAQCRLMELDQAVVRLDFALRYGQEWLARVS